MKRLIGGAAAILLCAFAGTPALAAKLDLSDLFQEVTREPWPKSEVPTGTGFFVDAAGHLLTAAHVIAGCGRIVVVMRTEKRTEIRSASLVGRHPGTRAIMAEMAVCLNESKSFAR